MVWVQTILIFIGGIIFIVLGWNDLIWLRTTSIIFMIFNLIAMGIANIWRSKLNDASRGLNA